MHKTDRAVVSAESVRDFYVEQIGADRERIDAVYNAADSAQLQSTASREEVRAGFGVPIDAPLAGIIARLTEREAHAHVFQAMASTPGPRKQFWSSRGTSARNSKSRADRAQDRVHFSLPAGLATACRRSLCS